LVGAGEHSRWNVDAQRLRSFEVYDDVEFRRQHDRQISSLFTLDDSADIVAGLPIRIRSAGAVADEAPRFRVLAISENRRRAVACISTTSLARSVKKNGSELTMTA